jgi:hypothetical protein
MKHHIGLSLNGIAVYIDLVFSPAAVPVARYPHLLALVKDVLQHTAIQGPKLTVERDMGHSVGYDFVVQTSDKDVIMYARQARDGIYSRFIKNGRPAPTQYVTIVLRCDEPKSYELYDVWIGRLRPPRPGSDDETAQSRPYWLTHAFVLDNQPLQARTVTKETPY